MKRLEGVNRRLWYAGLRGILRNRPVATPIDAARVRKILILRYDAIGDMVVSTPVLDVFRHYLPQARLDVVASPQNAAILRHDPRVTRLWIHDRTLRSMWRVGRAARREGYDVVFCLVTLRMTKVGILANLAGGREAVKIAVLFPDREHLYDVFFNVQLEIPRDRVTMAEIQARMVCDAFGWPFEPELCRIRFELGEENRRRAAAFHRTIGSGPFVAYNISSGSVIRRWSLERNRRFLERVLPSHPDSRFVVLCSPEDAGAAHALAAIDPKRITVFPPSTDVLDICAIIERCDMVVTPDTSIVHIAAAFDRPVMVLYSRLASYVAEWVPHGVPYRVVVTRGREPIETIPWEEAADAFGELYDAVRAR